MASLLMDNMDFTFETLRNRNVNAKELTIGLSGEEGGILCKMNADETICDNQTDMIWKRMCSICLPTGWDLMKWKQFLPNIKWV